MLPLKLKNRASFFFQIAIGFMTQPNPRLRTTRKQRPTVVQKKETPSSAEPANQREEPRETAPGPSDNRALSSAGAAESASVSVPTANPAPGEPKPKPAQSQSTSSQPSATLHRADSVEGAARGRSRRGSGSSEGMAEDASRAKDGGEPLAVFSMVGFHWKTKVV
jgi:hypothetical protein